jgi:hypothetical protein
MSRITNAIIGQYIEHGLNGTTAPMLDFSYGGQHGYSPNLVEWVSNQAYIRRNLICILLEAPGFFQLMQDPTVWVRSLKSFGRVTCSYYRRF